MSLTFARLTTVDPSEILSHMSDPRLAEHLPLLSGEWTLETVRQFVSAKEDSWSRDGLGHWAILSDGEYVGWGGFQKEGTEWDYGLVLRTDAFGLGRRITQKALNFAKEDARIPFVTFLLPPTRRHLGALRRLGAEYVGEVPFEGKIFFKFRLEIGGTDG